METLRFLLVSTYYPPSFIGGDAVHVKDLADLLCGLGHEVTVVYSADAARWKGVDARVPDAGESLRIRPVLSRNPRIGFLASYVLNKGNGAKQSLETLAASDRPDVVHQHNIAGIGWHPIRGRWRSIYTAHDYWAVCQRGDLLKGGRELCSKPNCVSCCLLSARPPQVWRFPHATAGPRFDPDLVIAPSRFLAKQLVLRWPDLRVAFCPNFTPEFGFGRDPSQRRGLLYVGVLSPEKGIVSLVKAVVKNRELTLQVVGDGPAKHTIRHLVVKGDAGSRIHSRGKLPREELNKLYQASAAVVIPSIFPENSPLVALESLSAATPVFATRTGGLPEILDPISRNLCLGWPELMERIAGHEWNASLGQSCRRRWESLYSPQAFLSRYMKVLEVGRGLEDGASSN